MNDDIPRQAEANPLGNPPANAPAPAYQAPPVSFYAGLTIEKFDTSEPAAWFVRFEATLRINHVPESDHYDHLLASLHKEARAPIVFDLQTPPDEHNKRYAWLRQALLDGHSKSSKEKLRLLLAGERIGDRKPSRFLAHLRELAPEKIDDDMLKEFWWKELPSSMRAILSAMESQSTSALAIAADAIHLEIGSAQINALRSTQAPKEDSPSPPPSINDMWKLLQDLQRSVNDLKMTRSRPKDRSEGSAHSRSRDGRSRTPSRKAQSGNKDGVCYFHNRFGDQAKRCTAPCKFSKN